MTPFTVFNHPVFRSLSGGHCQSPLSIHGGPKSRDHCRDALQKVKVKHPVVLPIALEIARPEVNTTFAHRTEVLHLEACSHPFAAAIIVERPSCTNVRAAADRSTRRHPIQPW